MLFLKRLSDAFDEAQEQVIQHYLSTGKSQSDAESPVQILRENSTFEQDYFSGGLPLFARSAKKHGDDAHQSFNDAKQKIKGNPLDTDGERLASVQEGFLDLCDGLISIRKQNGANTGIMTTAVLLNERTSQQVEEALRRFKS